MSFSMNQEKIESTDESSNNNNSEMTEFLQQDELERGRSRSQKRKYEDENGKRRKSKEKKKKRSRSREHHRRLSNEEIENNPKFQQLLKQMADMAEQIKVFKNSEENNGQMNDRREGNGPILITNENGCQHRLTQLGPTNEGIHTGNRKQPTINVAKSPSNETIYVPAVKLANTLSPYPVNQTVEHVLSSSSEDDDMEVDQINQFIDNIRLDVAGSQRGQQRPQSARQQPTAAAGSSRSQTTRPTRERFASDEDVNKRRQLSQAQQRGTEAIIAAEKFRASIQQPPQGMFLHQPNITNTTHRAIHQNIPQQIAQPSTYPINSPNINLPNLNGKLDLKLHEMTPQQMKLARMFDDDDEFFHITCHIDETLKTKIRNGEFVELEKLLQKPTSLTYREEASRLQLINKEGASYLVPAIDKSTKIDGIRKWEQAFRTYSAIYCEAHPTRSVEMLQYIDIINKAALTFSWSNVAHYDYVFRQLQSAKPFRSWAKTYTQMWNLTLNEPVRKFENKYVNSNQNSNGTSTKKNTPCWKFNKSTCTYGKRCKFEHRCSYCDSFNHPYQHCPKKSGNGKKHDKNKESKSTSSSSSN